AARRRGFPHQPGLRAMARTGRLDSRVALVTGAARGIGLGATRALAQEGARVMMCDIDADVLHAAAQELTRDGLDVRTIAADVANRVEIARRWHRRGCMEP